MNKNIYIEANQSLFDLSLQEYGSIEGVFFILEVNPTLNINSSLVAGDIILIPQRAPLNKKVVDYYNSLNIKSFSGSYSFATNSESSNSSVVVVHNTTNSYYTTVPVGGYLELPNINFTDSDGTTTSVPSMENIIATPNPIVEWSRPASWPDQPTPEEEEVSFLLRLEGDYDIDNFFSVTAIGNCEIWIDDTLIDANLPSATYRSYIVNSNDYGVYKNGVKWCWVKIRPQSGEHLTTINFHNSEAGNTNYRTTNFVEMVVNMPHHDNSFVPWSTPDFGDIRAMSFANIKHVQFNDISTIKNMTKMFQAMFSLEYITNFPDTSLVTTVNQLFRRAFSPINEFNLPSIIYLGYMFYNSTYRPQQIVKVNTTNALVNIQNFAQNRTFDWGYEISDCSGVTNANTAFYNCKNARRLICNELSVNVDIRFCISMSELALLDFVNSLADLTGGTSQSILMQEVTSYTSVNALASSKNWITAY